MTKEEFLSRFHHIRHVTAEPDFPLGKRGRPAAVLIPLVAHTQLTMLFTRRAAHLKQHGGQVSFPGGRQESHDPDLLTTALRETQEEIGLPPDAVDIIGQLMPYRTVSGYEVTPYIGLVNPPLTLSPDTNEVAAIFEVPMHYLMDKRNHNVHVVNRNGYAHPIYFIQWQQQHIWGATAAFVRNLANHLAP